MPELPEVEVCRRGIEPGLVGQRLLGVIVRNGRLRQPVPAELGHILPGSDIVAVRRRGKYLLIDCMTPDGAGTLIVHLGMSGRLRFAPLDLAADKHDHVDLVLARTLLRFTDPRRFGLILWQPGPPQAALAHPLLAHLGVEPLTEAFTAAWLQEALARRHSPIKPVLMDSHLLVGVGNIYASESLFRAGISPLRAANRIRETLGDRAHVNVTSYNRQALLTGEVATAQDRQAVEQMVSQVENVRSVVNDLAVMPPSTLSQRSTDTFITGKVRASLVDAQDISANSFKVVTERNTVYLMGRVSQREANRATDIARGVTDVRKVVRVFEIVSEEELRRIAPQPAPVTTDTKPAGG